MAIDKGTQSIIIIIDQKVDEYRKKYGQPEFIKLPFWIYRKLVLSENYTIMCNHKYGKLFGLTVCPTNSIERPDEIEVF